MGWTGVQYSALRAATAIAVAGVCAARLGGVSGPAWPLLALGLVGTAALVIGWRDRALTLVLLCLVAGVAAFVDGAPLVLPGRDVIATTALLVMHACVPVTPFGSFDARGRVDPRGDWHRPRWLGHAAWGVLACAHVLTSSVASTGLAPTGWLASAVGAVAIGVDGAVVLGLFAPRLRPPIWIAALVFEVALTLATPPGEGTFAFLLLFFCAADPAWWPGRPLRSSAEPTAAPRDAARLYYDGDCGFCHRAVRIVLSEDANTPPAFALRFAPLGGPTFAEQVEARGDVALEELPDSIVLALEDGRLLTRSAAALEIASRLGGLWRALAVVGDALPSAPLDQLYDGIARIRARLFAKPDDACPILPPELRARFDP